MLKRWARWILADEIEEYNKEIAYKKFVANNITQEFNTLHRQFETLTLKYNSAMANLRNSKPYRWDEPIKPEEPENEALTKRYADLKITYKELMQDHQKVTKELEKLKGKR